ncbi:hypothetical protein [uncultured Jannaschia sp.]|uniref:hypothetical protein n=1 Tax=uncultured Jannaschia sp. TaxID=293347 RepID=UPI00263750B9|nr:hypothetical protein [uncultured Jannaschia sp.]
MRNSVIFAACLAATGAHAQEPAQIRVGCHRYISSEIIWDKPRDNFVTDLRAIGYNPVDALAVATTLCRDPRYLGGGDEMISGLRELLRSNPPR